MVKQLSPFDTLAGREAWPRGVQPGALASGGNTTDVILRCSVPTQTGVPKKKKRKRCRGRVVVLAAAFCSKASAMVSEA
jgi:hypothetical protein